jgi:hypothetical protein
MTPRERWEDAWRLARVLDEAELDHPLKALPIPVHGVYLLPEARACRYASRLPDKGGSYRLSMELMAYRRIGIRLGLAHLP